MSAVGGEPIVRVRCNDWSSVTVPGIGAWQPRLRVSVIIPAYECQASLDLVLAALSRQTYPGDLLEVVVVDDGSTPPLELPKLRPATCRMVRAEGGPAGWGRAYALDAGARHSTGDILHWLDADMLVYPDHVEAQARWHHALPYAVTLGYKRFVDAAPDRPGWPTADQVAEACGADAAEGLFDLGASTRHDYVERLIDGSDALRSADHLVFMAHVGATAALRRDLYEASGGFQVELRLGEDTELGYRLTQSGAVFVPEPAARAWHLGATHVMRHGEAIRRYNKPFLAELMPHPRWLRRAGGAVWPVPLVTVVMPAAGTVEVVRAAVDSVLASDEDDVLVCLVGDWDSLTEERRRPLADPALELRLIAATYRHDPRVRLVTRAPETAFPGPYLLRLPAGQGVEPATVGRLVELADRHRVGLVAAGRVELWRTSALSRARLLCGPGEAVRDVVADVHGVREAPAGTAGVPADRLPEAVEVAGLRSWWVATGLVIRLALRRLRRRGNRDKT